MPESGFRIEKDASYKRSIQFATLVVLAVLIALLILAVPIGVASRATLLGLYLLFVFAFAWHRQHANWESRARRTTISLLQSLGVLLVAKAATSQVAQSIGLIGEFTSGPEENASLSIRVLLAIAGSPWQLDAIISVLGIAALVSISLFLRLGDSAPHRFNTNTTRRKLNGCAEHAHSRHSALDTYDSDLPPLVDVWVGRASELELLHEVQSGVLSITGIGGQGKSALAATYLRQLRKREPTVFWDWRDCREQADRFQLQLASVIHCITGGAVAPADMAEADIQWLSRFFFRKCGSVAGIVVFDNVDHYVDVENGKFVSSVSTFVNEALRVDHRMQIIFTCRPRINYPSVRFREVYLRGLSLQETAELFQKRVPRGIPNNQQHFLTTLHRLTRGHPLWLNIIAAHIARNPHVIGSIVERLETGDMDDLSKSMLGGIWSTLNQDQKKILLCMSELPRSLEAEWIFEYLRETISNHNRFDRAFRALKAISLVIEKASGNTEPSRYGLHPMVRTFVRSEYRDRTERQDYLEAMLSRCESIVEQYSGSPSSALSFAAMEQLTTKAELELARGKIVSCVTTLLMTSEQLVTKGLALEFVRIGKLLLNAMDWESDALLDAAKLDTFMDRLAHIMVELGLIADLRQYLNKYAATVSPGTARYIGLCDIETYIAWFSADYASAIAWGQRGEKLKKNSGLDTENDTSHNLALARRDSGQVKQALEHFLGGMSLKDVLDSDYATADRYAGFYGNIGRCLALLGKPHKAIHLYCIAYDLLRKEDGNSRQQLNLGYAALWIGDELKRQEEFSSAHMFYCHAENLWNKRAPMKADDARERISQLLNEHDCEPQDSSPEVTAITCDAWVSDRLSKVRLKTPSVA